MPTHQNNKQLNQLLFGVVIGILLFAVIEAGAFAGLYVLAKWKNIHYTPLPQVSLNEAQNDVIRKLLAGQTGHAVYHAQLGWSLQPLAKTPAYRINSQSIRSDVDFSEAPSKDRIRIAVFGDSFTFGEGVANDETWEHYLQALDPRYEVLNFGVGGYGQDQAYLRYLTDGQRYHADAVIIGFISENVFRNVNVFKPFYEPQGVFPLTKPRYVLNNGRLDLIDNPMRHLQDYRSLLEDPQKTIQKLGEHDYYYHQLYRSGALDALASVRFAKVMIYNLSSKHRSDALFFQDDIFNPGSEGYQLAAKIFDEFYRKAEENGSMPLIVVLPTMRDLSRMKDGAEKRYRPFLDDWRSKQYRVVDANELVFQEGIDVSDERWYTEDGHNSGLLHKRIAAVLHGFLTKNLPNK